MNKQIKLWLLENEIWVKTLPIVVVVVLIYVVVTLDIETSETNGVVGKTFLASSDYGDIPKVMVYLHNGKVAYISNKMRAPIMEGDKICLYQRKKLTGMLSYKLKAKGVCKAVF